jgi:hypothetical protein
LQARVPRVRSGIAAVPRLAAVALALVAVSFDNCPFRRGLGFLVGCRVEVARVAMVRVYHNPLRNAEGERGGEPADRESERPLVGR